METAITFLIWVAVVVLALVGLGATLTLINLSQKIDAQQESIRTDTALRKGIR